MTGSTEMPRQPEREPQTTPTISHEDYAEEAEAAGRAEAWPQAAALWRRAADVLRASAPHTPETFDLHAKYQAAANQCDHKDRVDRVLEKIARTMLDIPTLRIRKSDHLDFHEVNVWDLKRALAAAYEAGREDAT
jgi:hypothetical protein